MADVELIIKIPKEDYKAIKNMAVVGDMTIPYVFNAIRNGTLLPKGHGKLVDVNSIPEEDRNITVKSLLYPGTIAFAGAITLEKYVNSLPTIIKADKEREE